MTSDIRYTKFYKISLASSSGVIFRDELYSYISKYSDDIYALCCLQRIVCAGTVRQRICAGEKQQFRQKVQFMRLVMQLYYAVVC